MDVTHLSLETRIRRLVALAGVLALAVPAIASGCGGKVAVDGSGGAGTRDGMGGGGGAGASETSGGDGGGLHQDAGCALTSTGVGGDLMQVTECFAPLAKGCPSQYDAATHIIPKPCTDLVEVLCGPIVSGGQCCYLVTEQPAPCGG